MRASPRSSRSARRGSPDDDPSRRPEHAGRAGARRRACLDRSRGARRLAGRRQPATPLREVRTFAEYEAWYPTFAASGLVVPTWPFAYGGLDLEPAVARRVEALSARWASAASTRSASTSARRRSSPTAPRSSGCATCRRSSTTPRGGASSSVNLAPAPTSRRWPPGPSGTATTGGSRVRRCGPRGPTCPIGRCASPAPTPTSRSATASPTSSSTSTPPGWRCVRCGTSPARSTSTRCSSTASGSRQPAGRGRGRRVEGRQRHVVG